MSRGELRQRVCRLAGALARLGVEEERRVLVVLPDCPEYVYAFLGTIWTGAVPVLVNAFHRPDDYLPFVREARARAVIASAPIVEAIERETCADAHPPVLLAVGAGSSGSLWRAIEEGPAAPTPFPADADDAAFWLYSSGTTGRPKGVIHLQRSIPHVAETFGRHVVGISAADVVYSTSKLFFAYGLGASLHLPLAAGASVVLSPDPFSPARTWRILRDERPSLFFGVPAAYRALLDAAPPEAREVVSRIRCLVSAGEALPETLATEWQHRLGRAILDGLGSTEALHIFLSTGPGDAPGTAGRPVPGYELRVVDEAGARLAPGEVGQLVVRGGSLAAGYWQRSEATRRAFRGEWFATGDQAVENPDGTFRVLGRTDDMLKVSGQWVSPLEVEAVVAAVEGVHECAVVGVPGESGLTELVACTVSASPELDPIREQIERTCAESLPRYKRPKRILFVPSLPRTATGKIQRFALRNEIAARAAQPR